MSVQQLTVSAVSITKHYTDTTKFHDAIKLFNQAISLDSNNFNSYSKKFFLEFSLGEFSDAERSLNKLIKFRPDSAELFSHAGFFQEFRYDTTESKKSFAMAVLLYKVTLDTMDKKSPLWMYNWKSYALCIIMAGQERIIHDFLKVNCTSAVDSSFYDIETLTKTKEELLKSIRIKYIR
jgi:tetratricopeptide (TPR) repeat protein